MKEIFQTLSKKLFVMIQKICNFGENQFPELRATSYQLRATIYHLPAKRSEVPNQSS